MRHAVERTSWVAYARVSTTGQAEKELSIPAQLAAIRDFAARHQVTIDEEYVEAGGSGTDPHRPVFNRLLGAALRPGSTIGTIVVHHTSRFTRDATHARVVKSKLRKAGVRVLSVMQDFADDPMGTLMEGLFECIDQYESELNGLRTSAAMREAVKQGYWPGARAPYGYRTEPVEVRPGVVHHRLRVEPSEAQVIREAFSHYVFHSGGKAVARTLNQRGHRTRGGGLWSQNLVMLLLDEEALTGSVWWGRRKGNVLRPKDEWLCLRVEPIIDAETWALAQRLRQQREVKRRPGRAPAKPQLLKGLVWCGRCGASYQHETSGKVYADGKYTYGYYNCRNLLRVGKEACPGYRIPTEVLDEAIIGALERVVCTEDRARFLTGLAHRPVAEVVTAWRALIRTHDVGRAYVLRLIHRIDVHDERVVITPAVRGRNASSPETPGDEPQKREKPRA